MSKVGTRIAPQVVSGRVRADVPNVSNPPKRGPKRLVNQPAFQYSPAEPVPEADEEKITEPTEPYDRKKIRWAFSYEDTCQLDPCDDGQQETANAYGGFDAWKAMGAVTMKTRMQKKLKNLFWVYDNHLSRLDDKDKDAVYKQIERYVPKAFFHYFLKYSPIMFGYFDWRMLANMESELFRAVKAREAQASYVDIMAACPNTIAVVSSPNFDRLTDGEMGIGHVGELQVSLIGELVSQLLSKNISLYSCLQVMKQIEKLEWESRKAREYKKWQNDLKKWRSTYGSHGGSRPKEPESYDQDRNPNMTYAFSSAIALAVEAAFKHASLVAEGRKTPVFNIKLRLQVQLQKKLRSRTKTILTQKRKLVSFNDVRDAVNDMMHILREYHDQLEALSSNPKLLSNNSPVSDSVNHLSHYGEKGSKVKSKQKINAMLDKVRKIRLAERNEVCERLKSIINTL